MQQGAVTRLSMATPSWEQPYGPVLRIPADDHVEVWLSSSRNRLNLLESHPASLVLGRSGTRAVSNREATSRKQIPATKRTCLCSPTTHPGSFRCSIHKPRPALAARKPGLAISVARVGQVEGTVLVRRALVGFIRPSSHQQQRRDAFQPRRSRLSVMVVAGP